VRGGLNIQNTGFGPTAAIEVSNVFGQHGGKLNGKALSAVNTILSGQTTSIAGWVGNETFLVQAAGVAYTNAANATSPSFVPLVRGVYIADLGAAELLIGGGWTSGQQTAVGVAKGVNATFMDVQVQGEMGDMSYGVYADWVNTKAKSVNGAAGTNQFAAGANSKREGYSARIEIEPVHQLMIGLGAAQDKTTTAANVVTKVNSTQFALTYEVYQNMEINTFYKVDTTSKSATASTKVKTLFAEVEALF